MDLKSTYDKIAEDWDRDHNYDDCWVEGVDAFASCFKKGACVIDVGCGSGVKSAILLNKGLVVSAIDFSEEMIAIAKRKIPGVDFSVMDLYEFPSIGKTFDGIFAQAVLLHFPKKDIPTIFRNLKSKLNPGGYLYVAVKERRLDEQEEEMVQEKDYGYEYERFFSYFTLEEMKKHFLDAGFEITYESVISSGRRNWIQIIGKSTDMVK